MLWTCYTNDPPLDYLGRFIYFVEFLVGNEVGLSCMGQVAKASGG